MKRLLKAVGLLVGTAALVTVPALSASAAVSQHSQAVSAGRVIRTEIPLAPGGGSLHRARPLYTANINVSVQCASFVGFVDWGGTGGIANPAYLDVSGTAKSTCNSTTFVHVGYTNFPNSYGPILFCKTGPYSSKVCSYHTSSNSGTYGNIYVEVCSNRYGWICDRQHV